jgi:hypothetical protein
VARSGRSQRNRVGRLASHLGQPVDEGRAQQGVGAEPICHPDVGPAGGHGRNVLRDVVTARQQHRHDHRRPRVAVQGGAQAWLGHVEIAQLDIHPRPRGAEPVGQLGQRRQPNGRFGAVRGGDQARRGHGRTVRGIRSVASCELM